MKKILIIAILLFPYFTWAQMPLTLISAIDTALRNNYDIQIARNNTEIDRVNNTFGVAGGLPTVNGAINGNNSNVNLNQRLSNGTNTVRNGVSNKSYSGNVTASMVLFNGFLVTSTKKQLDYLQQQGELQLNLKIQNTIASVMAMYYDILRQQSYLNIIKSSIDVSSKKLEIVKNRYDVGMANEADLLQAQMDLNAAEQDLKGQQLVIDNTKTSLLQLLGVKSYYPFTVSDSIIVDKNIRKAAIISYLENNPEYLSAVEQIKINEQIVKEKRALRYPSIRINTAYNYSYNSSSAGFNLFTKNFGPAIGASMQIPIFNGTISRTQQKVAQFNVQNAEIEKENVLNALKADAIKTYDSYESTLQQIITQQASYENAVKLVNIVVQRFQLNQATILDVKAAQSSFEAAGNTLVNLRYSAKIAEIELKRLTSSLNNEGT